MELRGHGSIGVAYVVAYVILDALSFVQPQLMLGITPWSPQAGVTVAFLAWRGWRQAPWVFVAALVAEIVVRDTAPAWVVVAVAGCVGIGYGLLAAALSRHSFAWPVAAGRDAILLSIGGAATALLIAIAYVACYVASGRLTYADAGPAIGRYWVGDLNGIVTIAPLLLAMAGPRPPMVRVRGRAPVALAQLGLLTFVLWIALDSAVPSGPQFVYLLFVPVLWATLTWGVPGAALATLVTQLGLMIGTQRGVAAESLVELQFLLVTLGTTALMLGAVVMERARALERVGAREAEQRALLSAAPDAVLATDPEGRVLSANRAAERLFGVPADALLGHPLCDRLGDLDMRPGQGRASLRVRRADGSALPADAAWVPLAAPAQPGYLLLVRDVSEREHAQAELRARDAALARAMRFALAGELATALTHELNQPITALVTYLRAVEILAQPIVATDPRLGDTLGKASREALRASDVLRRLRDFYRTGTAELATFPLAPLIDEVASAFAERAAALGATIEAELGGVGHVRADRTQMQMVLHNLVGNALDAIEAADSVPAGCVKIRASLAADNMLRVRVEDSGGGIAPDLADQVFEPFVTDKPRGMGLGLTIARSLMRAQGGDLRLVVTRPGYTAFAIELPASRGLEDHA